MTHSAAPQRRVVLRAARALLLCVALPLVGCGGSGGGGAGGPREGVLSGVSGLAYVSESGERGVTDAEGRFAYRSGDTITFEFAGHSLPPVPGSPSLTLGDLALGTDAIRLLLNSDTDAWPANGLTLPPEAAQAPGDGFRARDLEPLDRLAPADVDRLLARYGHGDALLTDAEARAASGVLIAAPVEDSRLRRYLSGRTPLRLFAGPSVEAVPGIDALDASRTLQARVDAYAFDETFRTEMLGSDPGPALGRIEESRAGFNDYVASQIEDFGDSVETARNLLIVTGRSTLVTDEAMEPLVTHVLQRLNGEEAVPLDTLEVFEGAGRLVGATVVRCAVRTTLTGNVRATNKALAKQLVRRCLTDFVSLTVVSTTNALLASSDNWPGVDSASAEAAADFFASLAEVMIACYQIDSTSALLGCITTSGATLYEDLANVLNEVNATRESASVIDRLLLERTGYYLAELSVKTGGLCSGTVRDLLALQPAALCENEIALTRAAFCAIAGSLQQPCSGIAPGISISRSDADRVFSAYDAHRTAFYSARSTLLGSTRYARTQCLARPLSCQPARAEITRLRYEPVAAGWTVDIGLRVSNGSGNDLTVRPTAVRLVTTDGALLEEVTDLGPRPAPPPASLPARTSRTLDLSLPLRAVNDDALLQVELVTEGVIGGTIVATIGFLAPSPPPFYTVVLEPLTRSDRTDESVDVSLAATATVDGAMVDAEDLRYTFRVFGAVEEQTVDARAITLRGASVGTRVRVALRDAAGLTVASSLYRVEPAQRPSLPVSDVSASGADIALRAGETRTVRLAASGGRPPYTARLTSPNESLDVLPLGGLTFAISAPGATASVGLQTLGFSITDADGRVDEASVRAVVRVSEAAVAAFRTVPTAAPGQRLSAGEELTLRWRILNLGRNLFNVRAVRDADSTAGGIVPVGQPESVAELARDAAHTFTARLRNDGSTPGAAAAGRWALVHGASSDPVADDNGDPMYLEYRLADGEPDLEIALSPVVPTSLAAGFSIAFDVRVAGRADGVLEARSTVPEARVSVEHRPGSNGRWRVTFAPQRAGAHTVELVYRTPNGQTLARREWRIEVLDSGELDEPSPLIAEVGVPVQLQAPGTRLPLDVQLATTGGDCTVANLDIDRLTLDCTFNVRGTALISVVSSSDDSLVRGSPLAIEVRGPTDEGPPPLDPTPTSPAPPVVAPDPAPAPELDPEPEPVAPTTPPPAPTDEPPSTGPANAESYRRIVPGPDGTSVVEFGVVYFSDCAIFGDVVLGEPCRQYAPSDLTAIMYNRAVGERGAITENPTQCDIAGVRVVTFPNGFTADRIEGRCVTRIQGSQRVLISVVERADVNAFVAGYPFEDVF